MNTTSTGQTVTLSNSGLAPLSIAGASLSGANSAEFAQTTTCGATLNVNSTCTFSLTFKPLARGLRSATLVVSDGFPLTTQSVSLSGTGIAPIIGVLPVPLVFGTQLIATTSATQPLIVLNTGDAPLLFNGVTFGGVNASDYLLVANNCGAGLPALGSCTLDVTFKPGVSGPSNAVLIIASSDPFNPMLSVPISGVGTALGVSPSALAFASQTINTSTNSRSVTLTNAGLSPLTINNITLAGANVIDFTMTNGCGGSLRSGRSCTVSLRFRPTSTGVLSASLVVNSSDIGVPQTTVALSGTGLAAALSASPMALTFSSSLNTPGVAQLVTVSNMGTAPLTINSVNLGGTNTGQFVQNNNCPIGRTLAVAATCTINVTFVPTSTTPLVKSQTLTINVAAPATSQSIPLSGTVITPTYAVSLGAIGFANQAVNTTSPSRPVIVTNSGAVPLTLTNVLIGGSTRFAQTNNCSGTNIFRPFPATLAAGASCTINVTFRPTTATTSNASLTVSVGGGATPAQSQVALSGTGQ